MLRGESVDAVCPSSDGVLIAGRDADGDYNIWACDGYGLQRIGDKISVLMSGSIGIKSVDGNAMLIGSATAERHIRTRDGTWGRMNGPTSVTHIIDRDSTFPTASPGSMLMASATGISYQGTAFSVDYTDYVCARALFVYPEEQAEWEKVYLVASKVSGDCTCPVYARVNEGSWVLMASPVVNTTVVGIYEIPIPDTLRHGKRFEVKIAGLTNANVNIESLIVQVHPTPVMITGNS
jgi:hypothetical protein